jgi:ParB family transcriptional regulator, chromosome partitioning protein
MGRGKRIGQDLPRAMNHDCDEVHVAGEAIQCVNPFSCRMWEFHDRLDSHITEHSCKAEIESFETHGQIVPVLARRLRGDLHHDFELIYGARRLFCARHLNRPLLVEIRTLTDREAIVAMDIENRHRQDISPYERGLSYTNWLRSGSFASQDDIARNLKISASQVSRLLKLARLPSVIVAAFSGANEICENWGLEIAEALEDPQRRATIIRTARTLGAMNPRMKAQAVYRELLFAQQPSRRARKASHDEVVRDDSGAPLFRVRYHRSAIALVLPLAKVSPATLGHIRQAVCSAMQGIALTACDSVGAAVS